MELKTQALDRVLEALSPALAAELDRVVSETREALEQEFQKRLQSAVREAESASRQAAEAEQEQAVREARETTKNQVTDELNEQFKKTLEQATSALKSEASTELARVQEQLDQFRIFADAQKLLGEATSQPEILARFLKMTEPFAPAPHGRSRSRRLRCQNRRARALENPRQSRISRDHFPANDRSRILFQDRDCSRQEGSCCLCDAAIQGGSPGFPGLDNGARYRILRSEAASSDAKARGSAQANAGSAARESSGSHCRAGANPSRPNSLGTSRTGTNAPGTNAKGAKSCAARSRSNTLK